MEGTTTSKVAVDKGSGVSSILSLIYDGAVLVVTRMIPNIIISMIVMCIIFLVTCGVGAISGSGFNPFKQPVWFFVPLGIGAAIGIFGTLIYE